MSNNLRTRNGMPFNFVNGLKVRGMDIESLIPGIEGIPEAGSKYQFAGNGSNKAFTLPVTPYNKDAVDVYVKQLYVHPDDYTLVGDTVTLTEAPPALVAGETYNVVIKVSLTTLNGYVNANRVSFEGENLDDILEKGKPLANYSALRAYAGAATQVRITDPGIAGFFYYDAADTTSADNGGTVIVAGNGKRWKRVFDSQVHVTWFGAQGDGVSDDTSAIQAACNFCTSAGHVLFVPSGTYKITSTITINGISAICEDSRTTKFQALGNFTAFKFLCNGKVLKNFNLWFTPPVSSAAVGYQFGDGSIQFARNVVDNFSVRYASTSFFNNSDMWGNVFTQLNADFPLQYGFNFNAYPSGTTNSFRNVYSTNLKTTGSITAGSSALTVASTTNISVGQPWTIIGAGSNGPLIITVLEINGNILTLSAPASNTVTDTPVIFSGTAWKSINFSDTHFYNAYFDGYPSSANGLVGAMYIADSNLTADSIRFEGCYLVTPNSGLVDDRSSSSTINSIISFATYIDVGAGNYGFVYRCGTSSFTQHILGNITLQGFAHWSGGLKKIRVAANDNITFLGKGAGPSDCDDNGFEGCLFYSGMTGRLSSSGPATGSWEIGEQYFVKNPIPGATVAGACLAPGTFGTLSSVNVNTIANSNKITINTLSTLKRNQFITIDGIVGIFKILDIQTGANITALVVPAPTATITNAPASYPTPTFAKFANAELTGSIVWDPVSIAAGSSTTTTLSLSGAAVSDYVIVSFSQPLQGLQLTASVQSANTVAITLSNSLATAIDLASGTLYVKVFKR